MRDNYSTFKIKIDFMSQELIYQTIEKQIKEVYGIMLRGPKTSINSFNAVSEDNEEFLRRFQKEFQVDMSGFNYYDFFRKINFIRWY